MDPANRQPNTKLTLGADGKLYGTTIAGSGAGSVYSITPGGTFANLFAFTNTTLHGAFPSGEILRASDNTLYGVTREGGANGGGTAFKIVNGTSGPRLDDAGHRLQPDDGRRSQHSSFVLTSSAPTRPPRDQEPR